MTYDRAMVKMDLDRIADAAQQALPAAADGEVPRAHQRAGARRPGATRPTSPATTGSKPGFDDAAWKSGPGGFGTASTPGAVVGTVWNDARHLASPHVHAGIGSGRRPALSRRPPRRGRRGLHQRPVGQIAEGLRQQLLRVLSSPDAVKALKAGENTIAVHCHQTRGGQFIDVGLVLQVEQ